MYHQLYTNRGRVLEIRSSYEVESPSAGLGMEFAICCVAMPPASTDVASLPTASKITFDAEYRTISHNLGRKVPVRILG